MSSRKVLQRMFTPLIVVAVAVGLTACSEKQPQDRNTATHDRTATACDRATSQALAELYATQAMYPDRIASQLERFPDLYRKGGAVSKCAREFAGLLMQGALHGPSNDEIYQRSMDVAYRAGQPDLGSKVANSIIERRGELFLQADYILSLADALDQPREQSDALSRSKLAAVGELLAQFTRLACEIEASPVMRELCITHLAATTLVTWETIALVLRDQIMLLSAVKKR